MSPKIKKLILLNVPYLFIFYFANLLSRIYRLVGGENMIFKLSNTMINLSYIGTNPILSLHTCDLIFGVIAACGLKAILYLKGKNAKKFRKGIEYGSARWGTAKDIAPFMDKKQQNNILLTETEKLTMNSRPKQPKYARNKNILVSAAPEAARPGSG